jgi:DNA-binding XRE family transcriptional regulator
MMIRASDPPMNVRLLAESGTLSLRFSMSPLHFVTISVQYTDIHKSPLNRYVVMQMLPIQCRMARAALGIGVRDLAATAKVSADTITRFERGDGLKERTIDALRQALEASGIEFIEENGGGPGVRLKERLPKPV